MIVEKVAGMESPVDLSVDGRVAVLTLNRPDALNAIDLMLASSLRTAVEDVTARQDVGALLIRGEGRAFCAGGDVRAFAIEDQLPSHLEAVLGHLHAAIAQLCEGPLPVVAAVHGSAAGAGLALAAAADLVIASSTATFVMAYTKIGLSPDASSTYHLPRLVGLRRALELALTNRVLSADEAEALGLVTTVVAEDELLRAARQAAERLASGSRAANAETRQLLRRSRDLAAQLDAERDAIVRVSSHVDATEGLAAFLEKRAPRFNA